LAHGSGGHVVSWWRGNETLGYPVMDFNPSLGSDMFWSFSKSGLLAKEDPEFCMIHQ
jgi:hypothetical protein